MERRLIFTAYRLGRDQGTSSTQGYYKSPDETTIFCKSKGCDHGIFVHETGEVELGVLPSDYVSFDMSDAIQE